ncbi:PAC2 family protein [Candidatus Woesearchaeota archaeon]|nr:PAC2 family protein [Candidatus Woesearchaeota archaeon]
MMMTAEWKITIHKKVASKNAVMFEGMPGIGNVGKIAADVLAEQLKAVCVATFFSYCLPNSVFVQEDNTVELPKIDLYYKKVKGRDFFFLLGDVQPMKEEDNYMFTEAVLKTAKSFKIKEVIGLGGIGLQEEPMDSQVYCIGNDKAFAKTFEKLGANTKLYGVVGPIMGVTGLLLGLSANYGMKSAALLAETYAGPMHIGLQEARGLMKMLIKRYRLGVNLDRYEKDISRLETELKPKARQQELIEQEQEGHHHDTSYIG